MGIAMAINRKVIGCTRLHAIGLAVMLGVSLPAGAQDMPGEDEITPALALEVPIWWSIESVNIEASVNDGDEVDPHIRQRFTAVVKPLEDLFEHVDSVGSVQGNDSGAIFGRGSEAVRIRIVYASARKVVNASPAGKLCRTPGCAAIVL